MSNDYKIKPIKGNKEKGIFSKDDWVNEGDNHFISADNLESLTGVFNQSLPDSINKRIVLKNKFYELRINEKLEKRSTE